MEQIITSLLSQDAYKFSMGQAIYHQFSDYKTTWTFKCRNENVFFTPEMVEEIKEQIKAVGNRIEHLKGQERQAIGQPVEQAIGKILHRR